MCTHAVIFMDHVHVHVNEHAAGAHDQLQQAAAAAARGRGRAWDGSRTRTIAMTSISKLPESYARYLLPQICTACQRSQPPRARAYILECVLEREPGSGSIQFSAYGYIAPTRRLACIYI